MVLEPAPALGGVIRLQHHAPLARARTGLTQKGPQHTLQSALQILPYAAD